MKKETLTHIGEFIARYSQSDALRIVEDVSISVDRFIKDGDLSECDKDVVEEIAYEYIEGYFNAAHAKDVYYNEDAEDSESYKRGWNDCMISRNIENKYLKS